MEKNIQEAARAAMQLESALSEKYENLRREALQKTIFPAKKINQDWLQTAVTAMQHVSILAAQVTPEVYKSLALLDETDKPLTLEQVACLCNLFETLSPIQLNMHMHKYCAYQAINKATSDHWNTIVGEITTTLQEQYKVELLQKKVAQNSAPLMSKVPQA